MRRIAIVFEYGTLNGGEHSMLAVIDRLRQSEWEFVAMAPGEGRLAEALRSRGLDHIPLELRDATGTLLPRARLLKNILRAVRDCSPELVHANSLSMGRLTGGLASDLNLSTIAHLRDILNLSRSTLADLNQNSLLLAVSVATQQFHVAQGLESDRIRVVYNGVDCTRFCPRPKTGALKRELGLSDDTFLVATIGQIGLRKGQDVLADAARSTTERLPKTHYLLVGERNSGKAESIEFERQVIERFNSGSLRGRFHPLGYRSDVDYILGEIDLLIHPAQQEPLGRVLLEAAASAVPIIATDVGGTGEILDNGVSARLVPPNDAAALADALIDMHDDSETRGRFAAAACEQARSKFDHDRAAAELSAVWNKVASYK